MIQGVTDSVTVPDLVFSEMKFLQNNHGGNDHTAQPPDAKKKRKKDHARTREEDISAFFTTVRPVLADTDGNIQAKSRCPTGRSAGAKADRPRRTRDPSKAPDNAVLTMDSEGKASYMGFGSRGPRHESTNYLSWSESICAPSVTPGRPKNTSTVHDERIDAWNREIDKVSHGRGTAGHQEVPSSIIRDREIATSNRFRVSSVAPMPSGLLRSQSLPQPSSSPRRPNLVDRAVNRHTNEDVTSPSSVLPVLRGRVNAGHQEVSTTEGSVKTSHVSENAEPMQGRASTNVVRGHPAHSRPPKLPGLGGTLQHYNEIFEAEPQQAPSRRGRRAKTQTPPRYPGAVRQTRHSLYPRIAEAPTVRFVATEGRSTMLPNFSGPSIYVQQEQRQRLPTHLGVEDDGGYRYPDGVGQEYMSETGILDHEDFEDWSDEQLPYGLMKDMDDDIEGLDYGADDVKQMQEPEHTSVVTRGFWRPNRLY